MSKIFIHVGHGGTDPGAIGPTGLKEKDVTLNISKKVRDILERHNQTIKLSRETDLTEKSNIAANNANKWGADYVVSIHINSASNIKATGTETFAYSIASKGNILAKAVQKNLVKEIKLADRGVKYNNSFAIIAKPTAPAILVEVAFINNPNEEKLLRDETFLNKAAIGISKGILEYLNIKYEDDVLKVEYKGKILLVERKLINDTNYIGVRNLLEQMGYTVIWDESTQMAIVK